MLTLSLLLNAGSFTWAEPGHSHTHGSHVHGQAALQVVQEGQVLQLTLLSPAANLLGFEHAVNSTASAQALARVKTHLSNATPLFKFKPATCQLTEHLMDLSHLELEDSHANHKQSNQHQDIQAHYQYHCNNPNKLQSLSTSLIGVFPAIESLQVQWLVNGRQGVITLDRNRDQINFR